MDRAVPRRGQKCERDQCAVPLLDFRYAWHRCDHMLDLLNCGERFLPVRSRDVCPSRTG